MNEIKIIDYGLCNLKSIENAFKHLGIAAKIITEPDTLLEADHIVLPGVGAFKDGMDGLKKAGFIAPLKQAVSQKKVVLGICLGMQMLLKESYEFGKHSGLGIIDGLVLPFRPLKKNDSYIFKVPHIGWNSINKLNDYGDTPFSDLSINDKMYFVHSYFCKIDNELNVLGTTHYGSYEFHSIIKKGNIYGCQFHPERSGILGLQILKKFSSIKAN